MKKTNVLSFRAKTETYHHLFIDETCNFGVLQLRVISLGDLHTILDSVHVLRLCTAWHAYQTGPILFDPEWLLSQQFE
ncbi:hypothetical protein L1887_38189 [Cichorium endivia]|nr:hypothetical protein L1887_38189 [Cichorium endivia]